MSCKEGSLCKKMLLHCGEERSVQSKEEPLLKAHFRPRHWQSGTEVFHDERSRFSAVPCSEGLIFSRSNSTSEAE